MRRAGKSELIRSYMEWLRKNDKKAHIIFVDFTLLSSEPLPFEIFATMQTSKYNEVEKLVHKTIDRLTDLRIRQSREFFNVAPQIALDIFRDIAQTIDDAEVVLYEDNKPIVESEHKEPQKREVKRARFKFSMCGIKIGETV